MKKDSNEDFLLDFRRKIKTAESIYGETRNLQRSDLRFFNGSSDNNFQWPDSVVSARRNDASLASKPLITINPLPQHVKMVTNDFRQNMPGLKTIPSNEKGDDSVCEVYDDILRQINYVSQADIAYINMVFSATVMGEGYVKITTEYDNENSFSQNLKVLRVKDPFSILMDPFCLCPFGSDATWACEQESMDIEEFKSLYPKSSTASDIDGYNTDDYWIDETRVKIALFYEKKCERKKLNLYYNGLTAIEGSKEDLKAIELGMTPVKTRETEISKIMWYKTNGFEVLESGEWLGKYIPFVRLVNNESFIEGQIGYSGLVRNAKDPVRMYNYWASLETEMLALSPKAPFVGYNGQFDGFEKQWDTANVRNHAYLQVNATIDEAPGVVLPLPQRVAPPIPQTGIIQAKMSAIDDVKRTTGQYDASLGATAPERSGKAILARERQADTGTFDYLDNANKAIQWVGRQLVDLIPRVMDIESTRVVMGDDKNTKKVKINPYQDEPMRETEGPDGQKEKSYNLGIGSYDIMVTTGPDFMTKRQEAVENMSVLLQGNPELWKVAGDLFIKNMDWPGAHEISERFAKVVNPEMQEKGEDPRLSQMQQQMDQMRQMLDGVKNSFEAKDLEIKKYDAETKRLTAIANAESKIALTEMDYIRYMERPVPIESNIPTAPQMMPPMQEQTAMDIAPNSIPQNSVAQEEMMV